MAVEKEIIYIGANTDDFTSKLGQANELLKKLGEAKTLDGLASNIFKIGISVGVLGAAFFAARTAFDAIMDAEKVKSVNLQFEILSRNAGIVGDELKASLEKSADGLVENTRLLEIANRSMVTMGSAASRLGELLEVARKTSLIMGGTIEERFEALSRAIETGNQRLLRQNGIILDIDKAYISYAKQIGVTVGALSLAEKQHALMNAVIEKGQKATQGIDTEVNKATNSWRRFIVAMKELKEAFSLVIEKTIGPTMTKILSDIGRAATETSKVMISVFGDANQKAAIRVEALGKEIEKTQRMIEFFQGVVDKAVSPKAIEGATKDIEFQKKRLDELIKEQQRYQEILSKAPARAPDTPGAPTGPEADLDARREARVRFEKDLLRLREQRLKSEQDLAMSEAEADRVLIEQQKLMAEEAASRIQEINNLRSQGKIATEDEAARLIFEINENLKNKLILLEDEKDQRREQALTRAVDQSQSAAEGISRAFEAGAARNKKALSDWGALGKQVFDSFGKNSRNALLEFGAGTKDAAAAAKGFLFGMIADTAEAKGMELLLTSIWPPNPLGLAAGGALVALAGFLRSQGGVGGGLGGGGAGGGVQAGAGFGTRTDEKPTLEQQTRKSVTIQVMGHYFETEQTKTRLVEMVREATDATDFTIKQVGER